MRPMTVLPLLVVIHLLLVQPRQEVELLVGRAEEAVGRAEEQVEMGVHRGQERVDRAMLGAMIVVVPILEGEVVRVASEVTLQALCRGLAESAHKVIIEMVAMNGLQ